MKKERECPCPKTDCELHGDCVPCFKRHARLGEFTFCLDPAYSIPNPLEARVITRLRAAGIQLDKVK